MLPDFLDEIIAESAAADPAFASKVDAAYARRVFARRLVERRKRLGLSQSEVARRMNSKQPAVSRIESGGDVRVSTLERYAAALGTRMTFSLR